MDNFKGVVWISTDMEFYLAAKCIGMTKNMPECASFFIFWHFLMCTQMP